ncbi:hypothetical protein AAF712_012005 [Marasmius tenuissimus]|uniref:Uncharacterized protein n=1 Tax=Marasmius tenuissimus TaxID=585030 RepID=A0ABR2ZHR4_9AGAR
MAGLRAIIQSCLQSGLLGQGGVAVLFCFDKEEVINGIPSTDAFMINEWSSPNQTVPDSEIVPAAELVFNQLHENLLKILKQRGLNTFTLKTTFPTDDNKKPRFVHVTEELSPANAREILSDWYQTHWTRSGRIGRVRYADLSASPSEFYDESCLPTGIKILNPAKDAREIDTAEVWKLIGHFAAKFGIEGEVFAFRPVDKLSPDPPPVLASAAEAEDESEEEELVGASGTSCEKVVEEEWKGIQEESSDSDTDSDSDSESSESESESKSEPAFHPLEENRGQGHDQSSPSEDEGASNVVMRNSTDDGTDGVSDTVGHNTGTNGRIDGDANAVNDGTNGSINGYVKAASTDSNTDAQAASADTNTDAQAASADADVEMVDNNSANPVDFINNGIASAGAAVAFTNPVNTDTTVNAHDSNDNIHGDGGTSGSKRRTRKHPSLTTSVVSQPRSSRRTRSQTTEVPPLPLPPTDMRSARPKRQSAVVSQSLTSAICAPRNSKTNSKAASSGSEIPRAASSGSEIPRAASSGSGIIRLPAQKRKRTGDEGDEEKVSGRDIRRRNM